MTVARASMRSRSCTSIPWSALIVGPAYRCARSDRKSTRLNSSHVAISYAVFCLKTTSNSDIYTLSLHDALPICRTLYRDKGHRLCRCLSRRLHPPEEEHNL